MKFNASLAVAQKALGTKLERSNAIKAALGATRTLRCFRDSNSAAEDPFLTGVEFLNCTMTGEMPVTAGSISGFGSAVAVTISLPADLSTGKSILRIEGNGNFAQYSLGLAGSGADYMFTEQPNPNSGYGFRADASFSPYKFLPSGTGPFPPPDDIDRPAGFRFVDYTNPSSPVTSAICWANLRDDNLVADHPLVANNIGDLRMHRVPDGAGLVTGTGGDCFRWAMTVMGMNGVNNAEIPGKTVWRAKIHAVPHNRWAGFPYRENFNIATDTLAPNAFKIEVVRTNSTVLEVFEMFSTRDSSNTPGSGQPINGQNQAVFEKETKPVQPWWTCHMVLDYRSNRPTRNTYANHFCPPFEAAALDGKNVTAYDAGPDQDPVITGNYLSNGLGTWRVSPKWSRALNTGFDTDILDPDLNYGQMARDGGVTQLVGYGHEPGSKAQHIWFMSPGGSRIDRGGFGHVIAVWNTAPTSVRPHGAVPMESAVDNWNAGFANEGMHLHTNLERGITLAKVNALGIEPVCYNDCYYNGGNENYVPNTPSHAVRLLTHVNAQHGNFLTDKNGRIFTNEYQRDDQHNISTAAHMSYLRNDPMGFLYGKSSFDSHMLCNFAFVQNLTTSADFLTRQHAWFNWQMANMWIITSNDPRSLKREELEVTWQKHLEHTYDLVHPIFACPPGPSEAAIHGAVLRNLGTMVKLDVTATEYGVQPVTDSKAFYFGLVLMLMKQSGSWASMRARSAKCSWILDFMVTCLAKQSVDFFMDSQGRAEYQYIWYYWNKQTGSLPANWGTMAPVGYTIDIGRGPISLQNWIRVTSGSTIGFVQDGYQELAASQHYRAQFLSILKHIFPEFNYPRLDAANSLVDGWYNEIGQGWHYRFAMMGRILPPAVVGPITL